MIEKVIFDKNAEREFAKTELRAQFEKELLSSAIPQIYETKDAFQLKHTEHYLGDEHLNRRMEMSRVEKPTNQKPTHEAGKTHAKDVRSIITNEELQIFSKQKSKVNSMREESIAQPPTKPADED